MLCLLLGSAALCQGVRLLRQDPSTYTTTEGQTPKGLFALADKAEAGAAAGFKGVRYAAGAITTSGEVPSPISVGATNLPAGNAAVRAGNLAGEANVVLGREVIAATGQGARAAAGTGVAHTAAGRAAVSSNTNAFRPAAPYMYAGSLAAALCNPTSFTNETLLCL
uniref:Uncharacterized protein n=1 Tax=Tetradesmus obliquus TaxID=3088 RepID=A0A383V4F9_TETOB|eukprot:jgi/Sobl393_1/1350/SZX59823.1